MLSGLGMPAKLAEQVSSDRRQLRVVPRGRGGGYRFQDLKSGRGIPGHTGRHRPVEIDDRAGPDLAEDLVQGGDAPPVGVVWPDRSGMTGRDGRLEGVRTEN